jgi:hypothetical protein
MIHNYLVFLYTSINNGYLGTLVFIIYISIGKGYLVFILNFSLQGILNYAMDLMSYMIWLFILLNQNNFGDKLHSLVVQGNIM